MNPNILFTQIDPGGIWHLAWFFGLAILMILGMKKHVLEAKVLWLYIFIYALFILEYPAPHFKAYTLAFQTTAGQLCVEMWILTASVVIFGEKFLKFVPWAVGWTIACVWGHYEGLLIAPSFNTAFIALSLPFLPSWLFLIALLTILTHHGSTALLIIAAQAFAHVLKKSDTLRLFFILVISLVSIAYLHHTGAWFDGAERLEKYERLMRFWFYGMDWRIPYALPTQPHWAWVLFGVGPGTFMWFSLTLERFKGNLFLQMHSDWLQILWELGVVGLGLTIAVFMRAAKNAWSDQKLLSALFGCAAFGLTYHPMRWFPTALLTTLIVYLCLNCRKHSYREHP